MKLHLPTPLRAALMATFAAVVSLGSAAYASTTYSDLTTPDYFEANSNVYNTGKGTFYLETPSCDLNLTLTLNLNKLNDFQSVHDYANGGYYSPFVTWTYNNNPGATYGMADVARGYSGVDYDSGFTGYWAGKPWTTGTKITTESLWSNFADTDGNVTLTINNTPNGTTNNVVVTAVDNSGTSQTLYSVNGLRSQNYTSQHITAFTVNMNYVTSVTLNTASTLDSSNFTPPKDYSIPFQSQRTDGTSVGRVMFLGDSITHGVQDMSYRWDMFKTFVDNGIENEIAGPLSGYHSQPLNSDFNGDFSTSQYGGETFVNAHYAQSSGRTHNMLTASGSVNALGNSTGVNYGGVSSAKTGKDYNADTFVMMMGTNDILSDGAYNDTNMPKVTERLLGAGSVQNGVWVNANQEAALIGALGTDPSTSTYTGKWGTMGQIIDNMKMDASDTMYIVSIPTWGEGRTGLNGAASYVADYNVKLEKWVESYNASHTGTVKYVDVNKGLVNVTRNGQFLAPDAFFRTAGGDYIHPNEQGALIIAGNLAQGMGIGGRTAGLTRSAVGHEGHNWQSAAATINLSAGQNVQAISNAFTIDGGYTIDFGATFGDGSANGWMANSNALSVFIGDGTNSGTLKISEGYISWGDKLLYCQDNHLTTNDKLRVAYTQGNEAQNIGSGYYVWLGDKLIGQALTAGTGNTTNGVTLTSTGGSSVITGLSYTNTAYAPSTNFITAYDNGLVSSDGPTPPPVVPLTPMPSHDNAQGSSLGLDFSQAGSAVNGATAANNATAGTNLTVTMQASGSYFGAVNGSGNTRSSGDVNVNVTGSTAANNAFGVVNASLTKGNISMVFSNDVTVNSGSYTTNGAAGNGAFIGSYSGDIGGTLNVEVKNATLEGNIQMGVVKGTQTIGATNLILNAGATVKGDILGGSTVSGGTISGDVKIAVNGGTVTGNIIGSGTNGTVGGDVDITITGGTINGNITAKSSAVTMTNGKTAAVNVEGNKALIKGNITADKVSLKNVTNSGHTDGFDQYEGTIRAADLELNEYTADEVKAQLVGEHLHVTGNSSTNVSKLNLTACDITVDDGSSLTLSGLQEYGHTTTYTGNITIAKGTTFSVAEPTEGVYPQDENGNKYTSGANGFKYTGYVYDVLKPTENSTGRLFAEDGQPLGLTTNLTLQGAGELEGAFFVYKADTGILSAFEKILEDTCYINTGVLVYAKEAGAYGAKEALQLNNGANLVMADNLADGVNIQSNGGTLTLLDKVKLDASRLTVDSEKSTILAGSGTFALAAGSMSLGAGLSTDAEEWKGTILMSTTAGQTIAKISAEDLRALAPNADAWVEMNNVTGYFASTDQIFTSNIRLMGDKALHINNGYAKTYTFAGDIAGDGTFTHKYDGNSYTFQGDISEWVGAFETTESSTYNRATGVTLEGKATTLNAALHSNAGSALNLTLGDITNGASAYTFNNEVVVNELNASGKNIVLGAADDALPGGSLEVSGTATMAQLTMQEGTAASFGGELTIGSLNLEGGNTVHLGENATLNAGSVHAAAGSSSSLSGTGTFVIDSSMNNANTAQTLPSNMALDSSAWHGTVQVNGGTMNIGTTIQGLTTGDSWVELRGVSGYLGTETTYSGNIILTNNGDAAAFNISSSVSNKTTTLSGNIKGEGDITRTIANANTLCFSGDISEWTGTYYNGKANETYLSGTSTVIFDKAGVVNANFVNNATTTAMTLCFDKDITFNGSYRTAGQALNMSFNNGSTVSIAKAGSLSDVTLNGGSSATFAESLTANTLNLNGGSELHVSKGATFTGNITVNGNGSVDGTVTFGGTAQNVWLTTAAGDTNVANFGKVIVERTTTNMLVGGNANDGIINIGSLSSETDKTIQLTNCVTGDAHSAVFNLGGGEDSTFRGTFKIGMGSGSVSDGSSMSMVIKDNTIAKNAIVDFAYTQNKNTDVALVVAADEVSVKGLKQSATANLAKTHFAISSADSETRTLKITGDGTYSNAAAVGENVNLTMSGSGSQTFRGDMSAFNGKLTVENGTMDIDTDTISHASGLAVSGEGSILSLKQGAEISVNEIVLGNGGAIITSGELAAAMQAAADPTPYSGGTSAEITVSGTAGEHAKLQATGDTTMATNLTLGSNVDMVYSNAAQGINLAGHSLTLSAGETTIYLSDEMLVTLNSSDHLVLFSNVSSLEGIELNPVDGQDGLSITPAGLFFRDKAGNALNGQYQLAYNAATQEVYVAPEPATATLSLLALAALAARRRRK